MAKIILSKYDNEKAEVDCEIKMTLGEFKRVGSNIDNLVFIAGDIFEEESRYCSRGRMGLTKYLLVPRKFRKFIDKDSRVLSKLIRSGKDVYVVYKFTEPLFNPSSQKEFIQNDLKIPDLAFEKTEMLKKTSSTKTISNKEESKKDLKQIKLDQFSLKKQPKN